MKAFIKRLIEDLTAAETPEVRTKILYDLQLALSIAGQLNELNILY